MTRSYNERRNQRVIILVERRRNPMMPKQVAIKLHLTLSNVYQILHRYRRVKVCQTSLSAENHKVA